MKKNLWIIVDGDTGDYGYELNYGKPDVCTSKEQADTLLEEHWNNLVKDDPNWNTRECCEFNKEEGYFTYSNGDNLVAEQIFEVEIDI